MTDDPSKPSKLAQLRERHPWLDHLVRAEERYTERHGDHYAAAITYFSILALVPLLMVAFAAVALVLLTQPELLAQLQADIARSLPAGLDQILNPVIDQAIHSATTVGIVGLLVALYSGLGWMTNLRDALSEQWGQRHEQPTFLRRVLVDLASLVGLGLALVVSFGLTAAVSGFAGQILALLGLAGYGWAHWVLQLLGILLGLLSGWLVFLWVFARLPREPVTWRSAARAALAAAIGLEIIKRVMVIYLGAVTETPAGAAFGPILGLLIFVFTVSRFVLYLTAWAATARENRVELPPQPPPPAVIRPEVTVHAGPGAGTTAGLLGAGAVAGLLGGRLLSRRP
ncbi:MAG TPA: inner membrane protein YhjD [Pseudonocardia sp.]